MGVPLTAVPIRASRLVAQEKYSRNSKAIAPGVGRAIAKQTTEMSTLQIRD